MWCNLAFFFYFHRSAVKKLNGFVHHSNSRSTLQHCHYWSANFILYHTARWISMARVIRNCSPGKCHVADQLSNLFLIITFDLNYRFVILATLFHFTGLHLLMTFSFPLYHFLHAGIQCVSTPLFSLLVISLSSHRLSFSLCISMEMRALPLSSPSFLSTGVDVNEIFFFSLSFFFCSHLFWVTEVHNVFSSIYEN